MPYGLGLVFATQNPVDLDYKGLSNTGTDNGLIGRLQTERDKMRVMEGLEGAATEAHTAFDRGAMERLLASLGNRIFLMNNVHEDRPQLFETRWTLSYLRGPITKDQIRQLMQGKSSPANVAASPTGSATARFGANLVETRRPCCRPMSLAISCLRKRQRTFAIRRSLPAQPGCIIWMTSAKWIKRNRSFSRLPFTKGYPSRLE